MSTLVISAPDPSEYAPYYGRYIGRVEGNDILATLKTQASQTRKMLSEISDQDGSMRYAPGKWSIKELVGHMIDAERIFAYRALRISRGDETPIEGFEQDGYVTNGPFEACTLRGLTEEFAAVRATTLLLFQHLQSAQWSRRGIASGKEVSVRALAYIVAGHEVHHCDILRDRYLSAIGSRQG